MKMYKVTMNDGSYGCLDNLNNCFIVMAENKEKAEMIARNTNPKFLKSGKYVKYAWDCFIREVGFNTDGLLVDIY